MVHHDLSRASSEPLRPTAEVLRWRAAPIKAARLEVLTLVLFSLMLFGILVDALIPAAHPTHFGEDYSESGFCSIRAGSTLAQVLARVGQPLDVRRSGVRRVLAFSEPAGGSSYAVREVTIDSWGWVTGVRREFE